MLHSLLLEIKTRYYSIIEYRNVIDREIDIRPLEGGRRRARGAGGEALRVAAGGEALRVAAAEACGAALLVLLSCVPAAAATEGGPVQRALAAGLTVALIVQCFDHVSGAQLNPTVTVAAALSGRVAWTRAAVMCLSQLCGAILGAAATRLLTSADVVARCVTVPASHITEYQAVAIETVLGVCLSLANLASWDVRNQYLLDSWPLRIGFAVTSLSLVAGDLTGASINPVRSFAPALCVGNWTAHWVYWLGPLSGSCVAVTLYSTVWRVDEAAPPRAAPPRAVLSPVCAHSHSPDKA